MDALTKISIWHCLRPWQVTVPQTVSSTGKVQGENRQASKKETLLHPLSLQILSAPLETELHIDSYSFRKEDLKNCQRAPWAIML